VYNSNDLWFGVSEKVGYNLYMSLLWIKIGKAFSAIQEDGLFRSSGRILSGIWSLARPLSRGDVLLISGGVGDSARYRTKHIAEFLVNNGVSAQYTVQDNIFLSFRLKRFRVFVFHRVLVTEQVKKMIARIKESKGVIIFETDDLVFDKKYFKNMAIFEKMNVFEKKQYEKGVGAEMLEDPSILYATTTTKFLKKKLEERGKKVFIVPNMLSKRDVFFSQKRNKKINIAKNVDIGYFSGTKSHDRDFAVVEAPLLRLLKDYPHIRLVIAGPLVLQDTFSKFSDRIIRLPFVSRKKHFENIASVDINIAPLEMGNPFCEAKSELKFFEAGIMGIPTVASATQTFTEAIRQGEDGFFASNQKEWYTCLSKLIQDQELRVNMGKQAKKTTVSRYTTSSGIAQEYLQYINKSLKKDI
jgi:glycosyltransferase involved in cell wall biosynthesis